MIPQRRKDHFRGVKVLGIRQPTEKGEILQVKGFSLKRHLASRDMLEVSEEPPAPAQLRGFRLHTIWTRQPGEDLTCRVGFPHLFGETSSPLLDYVPEIIPLELFQGPKLAITLKPPSKDHWNTASDLVLPVVQDQLWERHQAK